MAKTELEEAGESTDGMVESTAKLRQEVLALSGVDIMLDSQNFKSTYQIMDELAAKWEDLSDIAQASIIELMAGKHQGNVFASLMSNFDTAREALEVSMSSSGSAMKEHEKWSKSLEAGILRLKAAWQGLSQTFLNSDFLKGGIDLITGLISVIDKLVGSLGTLGTIGLGTGIFGFFKNKGNNSSILKGILGDISSFGSLASDAVKSSGKLSEGLKNVGTAASQAGGSIIKRFTGSLSGTLGIIGLVVSAVGLAVNAYKNYKDSISEARQETIESSNKFLDAAGSFEQAYIKYSGKTDLTAEEESELEAAINGTVDALGNKSSALKTIVNGSNDYLASLEAIADAELEASARAAKTKRDNAELELKDTVKGWTSLDGSEIDIDLGGGGLSDKQLQAINIADRMDSKFVTSSKRRGGGSTKFTIDADASVDEVIEYYEFLKEYQEKLSDKNLIDTQAYESVNSAIEKMSESISTYIDGVYDAVKAQYQLENDIPKTVEEYLDMREAILKDEDIASKSFDTRKTLSGNLDSEYSQLFDLSSAEAQARKFVGLITGYDNGSDGTNEIGTVETFLNMRTAVNNNECTVGQYMSEFNKVNDMADEWSGDEQSEFKTTFGLDTDSIKQQYDEAYEYLSKKNLSVLNDYKNTPEFRLEKDNIKDSEIKKFLNGLSVNELQAVVSLQTELDWENDNWNEILNQIKKEAKLIEAISFDINIEDATAKLESLNAAMSESVSGSGLTAESMTTIEDIFGSLNNYDPSKLFERTTNGIRLNSDELRKLNSEYKNTNISGLKNKMSALGDKYNQTREELYNLTYGTDEYNDKAKDLADIEAQIQATEKLASQYKGLTSAYQEWQMAESSGNQRDMYESIIQGFETVGDELSRGWLDDGTIEFLELLKGEKATIIDGEGNAKEINIATASAKELKQVWDDLDKTIEHTAEGGSKGYSISDFFTVDENGNSTSKGVYNFLDAIGHMEEEMFGGQDVVKRDKKGNVIGFNFDLVGGDKVIAEALGVSEELVQIMVRAADDAGFVVTMDGTYEQLDVLKEKAQLAAEEMNKILEKNGKSAINIDMNTDSVKDIDNQLTQIKRKFGEKGKDGRLTGAIDMSIEGAEEALTVASTLQSMKDKLTRPAYMNIQVSQVEDDLKEPLQNLQDYRTNIERLNQAKLHGADTTELESSIEESKEKVIADLVEIQETNPDLAADLDIKGLTKEEIAEKVEAGEITIPATVDIQMEMSDQLGILVDKALLDAGIIDEDEFKKRVNVYLEAGEVDTSDVEDKTEDAVNGKNNKNSNGDGKKGKSNNNKLEIVTDVEIKTGEVDVSDVDKKTEETVNNTSSVVEKDPIEIAVPFTYELKNNQQKTKNGRSKGLTLDSPMQVKTDAEVTTGKIDTSKAEENINKTVKGRSKGLSKEPTTIEKNIEIDFKGKENTLKELDEFLDGRTTEDRQIVLDFVTENNEVWNELSKEEKQLVVDIITDESALESLENHQIEIEAFANIFGVEKVDDLAKRLEGLDDEQILVITEVIGKIKVDELKSAMDGLSDEQVKAIADAIGKGDVDALKTAMDGLSDEQVQAIAKALGYDDVNSLKGAMDNLTDKDVQAIAQALGITDVDSLKAAIDRLSSKDVQAVANVDGKDDVNSLQSSIDNLKGKTITVWASIKKKASDLWSKLTGGGEVDGTAHANGTAFVNGTYGRAFKQGNWGTKDSGVALGGEEDPELLVRNGRWHLIGEKGAEFFGYKKGDIIFNASQTKEIFEKGKITHGNGRGKALVSGTAFSKGSDGGLELVDDNGSSITDYISKKSSSKKSSSKSSSSSKKSSSSSSDKDEFEETFDWIEIAISRIERAIDRLDQKASSTWRSWSTRNSNLRSEISKVNEEIDLQNRAYKAYMAEANSVGLSDSWKKKVQNGEIDISTIKDEDLAEKIKSYQEWYFIMPTYLVINM